MGASNQSGFPSPVSLGCGVYQWTCHVANKSPQHHPQRCDNGCLSMVVNAYFLSTLCYRVPKWYSHQTQHGGRSRETLVLHIVQYTKTVFCTCFPQETTTCGTQHSSSQQGESPSGFRGDNSSLSEATISLHTSHHKWVWSTLQLIPATLLPPHWVLQRGTAPQTPQSCKPILSLCQMMCYTFQRRWTMPWFTYSPSGPQ